MLTYCLVCKKNTENFNTRVLKTKNGRTVILSQCDVCGSKKSIFAKEQEAKGLLSNLGIKTPLNKVPLLGDILFQFEYKMNEIVNKFLLAGDKFMAEMHLKQPFLGTYSACRPFTKHKKRIQKFVQTGIQIMSTRMNWIRLVFSMMQHILIAKTWLKEQLLITF